MGNMPQPLVWLLWILVFIVIVVLFRWAIGYLGIAL